MKYIVLKVFTDNQDGGRLYHEGEAYPREGLEPTEERIAELSGKNNKRGIPLITATAEPEEVRAEDAKAKGKAAKRRDKRWRKTWSLKAS